MEKQRGEKKNGGKQVHEMAAMEKTGKTVEKGRHKYYNWNNTYTRHKQSRQATVNREVGQKREPGHNLCD